MAHLIQLTSTYPSLAILIPHVELDLEERPLPLQPPFEMLLLAASLHGSRVRLASDLVFQISLLISAQLYPHQEGALVH